MDKVKIAIKHLLVGHAYTLDGYTGVSVILFENGATAGACICGKATSTRQADGLQVDHIVNNVNAFLFTGGSAFGLDATGGVLKWLEEKGRGLPTKYGLVPVCPTAALFDIGFGSAKVRPDAEMAYRACENAKNDFCEVGSIGAGTGATVGKLFTVDGAMKGGFGSATVSSGKTVVQAFVACNGFGDVKDYKTGKIIAGAREKSESLKLADTMKCIEEGRIPKGFFVKKPENTVLMSVVTNARLSKAQCSKVAELSVEGLKKVMSPALAPMDGDVVFCASCGEETENVENLGKMAASAIADALICSIVNADGYGIVPAYKDLVSQK